MKKLFTMFVFVTIVTSTIAQQMYNGHEYVDLGLPSGTLWATCNVGATNSENYGDYFAWGEVETKSNYDSYLVGDYKWGIENRSESPNYGMTKYNQTDEKNVLESADDAANANWGGAWRMPTSTEQQELLNECSWTWTTLNEINGYNIVGKNNNSIFLPAAGQYIYSNIKNIGTSAYYWSSSIYTDYLYYAAYGITFGLSESRLNGIHRFVGCSVRPVVSKSSIVNKLENIKSETTQVRKVIENGQVIIIKNGVHYNILGTQVK